MGNQKKQNWSEEVKTRLLPSLQEGESVSLSVIIPTYNCSEVIGETLESLKNQIYGPLEVIIIDAGSTDRTLEIANSYAELISRIYSVAGFHLADMINRGISLASGDYVTFLFPGSIYLTHHTFETFSQEVQRKTPDLAYCGSILREVKREPLTIFDSFSREVLGRGLAPLTLPACWFRSGLFKEIGKFDTTYSTRVDYEYCCRIASHRDVKIALIDRVLVDLDYGLFSYAKALRYVGETWRVLLSQYGWRFALYWVWKMNHVNVIRGAWRRVKEHLFRS